MIKKILLTLGILSISIINITFGVGEFVGQGKIGQYVLNPIDGDFYVGVDKNFNLKSIHNGEGKNIFVVYTGTLWGFYVSNDTGKNISLYANQWRDDGPRGGTMTYYYLCDYVNDTTFTTFSGCVQGNYGDSVNTEYIAHLKVGDDYFFGSSSLGSENHGNRRNPFIGFNISELNKSIVFYAKAEKSVNIGYGLPYDYSSQYGVNRSYFTRYNWDTFSGGLVYNNPYDLTTNGCIGPNCDSNSSGFGFNGNIEISDSDIINYFESIGFSENLCFVGTWDLSSNSYDDFKFTKNGNGEHIFNFFRYAYNIGTGEEYKLHYVGNFLDELYQNNYTFKEILHSSGDLINIFEFNYPTNNYVSWYSALYNDSLYPYLNKPLVYQLYPHQLYYYLPDWDINDRKYDLAEYCYFKLGFNQHRNNDGNNEDNYGNAGNLQFSGNSALIQNVSNYLVHMSTYDSRIMTGNFWGSSGSSGSSVNIAGDWHGSPIDYFVEQNLSGSYEDFDSLSFFNQSFNRFKGVFGDLNSSDFGFGYLPGYIITFMLAFILFRFLSH